MKNKLLFFISILFLAACDQGSINSSGTTVVPDSIQAKAEADPYRLDPNVAPTFQQLTLAIDPQETDYSGSTVIELVITSATDQIRLHAQDIDITTIALGQGTRNIAISHESGEHGILLIKAEEALNTGAYTLRIEFKNNFDTDGEGINRTEHEGDGYIFSQFESIHARKSFPCFDEPGYKYPWQLTISVPTGVTAVTNTPIGSSSETEGWVTTAFKETPALPSYLIAVAVGPFEFVDIPGMSIPGRVVTPRGMSALAKVAVETTPPLLASLENYFGQPYPFAKLDLIATFQSFSGAMEHPGAITYSDFYLLLDETASQRQKTTLIRITAHELAHQWFGNLVTMNWWDDLWLNESFADWMGDKTMEEVYPDAGGDLSELRKVFRIMDFDAQTTTKPIRHKFKATDDFSDGVVLSYYKGKSVITMFERAIGERAFREGVVRYLQKYSRKNADAADFWASMNLGAEFDFAAALATFIDFAGIPLVSVSKTSDRVFEFTQSRFLSGGMDLEYPAWIIPVTYRYRMGNDILEGSLLLDEASKTVEFENDVQWFLPNANQQGYYRWQIPDDMLTALSAETTRVLTERERMGLVSNLWALLSSNKLDGGSFVESILNLSSDTAPSVITALIDQLNNIDDTFVTEDLESVFAKYIRATLRPTLERIGAVSIRDEPAEQAALRPEVLFWLADFGADEDARAFVSDYVERFLSGDIPSSALVEMSLRNQARRGDQALFDKYITLLESASSPGEQLRYLQAVGSFRDPVIVAQVLAYIATNPLKPNDIVQILRRVAALDENHDMFFDWLMANDTYLRERLPEGTMGNLPYLVSSCSEENLKSIRNFYGDESRAAPGIETALIQQEESVRDCAQLRHREQESVANYLKSL